MNKLTHSLCLLTSVIALGAGACSSSSPGGTTGAAGSGGGNNYPLTPTDTGYVDDRANTGVVGAWYAYADSIGSAAQGTADGDFANSDCIKKGGFTASQCSVVNNPKAGAEFPPTPNKGMCTDGTAAVVLPGSNGMSDYSDMWGAGIGLDFNNPGGDAGAKADWDGSAYGGVEFDIVGDNVPAKAMRVNFPFTGEHGTDSPYYQGKTQSFSALASGDHVTIHWSDVAGPKYLSDNGTTPPAFDPHHIQSIQFQVFTNATTATPYSFCINNLAVLK